MPYGRGFGFRGWSPPWPFFGRGRGGLPRCWAFGPHPYGAGMGPGYFGYTPSYDPSVASGYEPPMSLEEEKRILLEQVTLLKTHLEEINRRIEDIERQPKEKSQ
jgi:hypothetical protein